MTFWWVFAFLQLLLFVFFANVVLGYLRHRRAEMPLLSSLGWKPVDEGVLIIVPAKDEEAGIGPCLERLVQLEGLKKFKVVPVDDRSVDGTGAKMREMRGRFPDRIENVAVERLPEGWLGKNHACWEGVRAGLQAMPDAEYLLFTDGDVKFHPHAIAESITWMKAKRIDFMTLIEEAEFEGLLEPAYLLMFGIILVFFQTRPWLLGKEGGRNFMGNGAYLLVRRSVYEATAAHRALKLEVVEDLRMGLLMRSRGYRCATAVGLGRMWRRWQPGFPGIFKGLLKNAFAAFEYSVPQTVLGMVFFPFVFIGPLVCLVTGHALIGSLNIMMIATCFYLAGRNSRLPWFSSFLISPFTSLAASANLAASAFKVIRDGGVAWRGTLYPLSVLKENCLTVRKAFAFRR